MSLFVIYFGTNRRYERRRAPRDPHGPALPGAARRHLHAEAPGRRLLAVPAPPDGDRPVARARRAATRGTCSLPCRTSAATSTGRTAAPRVSRRASCSISRRATCPDLSRHIVTERVIDPRYFRDTLNSHLGSAFSVEPMLTQSAWFRPHNRSEDVPNLYFVGAGTHPGAGLPGVLQLGEDRGGPYWAGGRVGGWSGWGHSLSSRSGERERAETEPGSFPSRPNDAWVPDLRSRCSLSGITAGLGARLSGMTNSRSGSPVSTASPPATVPWDKRTAIVEIFVMPRCAWLRALRPRRTSSSCQGASCSPSAHRGRPRGFVLGRAEVLAATRVMPRARTRAKTPSGPPR